MIKILFLSFCAGIVVAGNTDISFLVSWGLAILFLILSVVFLNRRAGASVLILCLFFSGAALLKNTRVLPYEHISRFTPDRKSMAVEIEGVIDSDPAYKKSGPSFVLEADRIMIGKEAHPCGGKLMVRVSGDKEFRYGDRLLLPGSLYKAPYFRLSQGLNYRDHLERSGIYSVLSVKKDADIKIIARDRGNVFKAAAFRIRHRMQSVIESELGPLYAGILNAVILGKREGLSESLRKIFVQTGTVHIIAISGLHVGIVAFLVLIFLSVIRVPRKAGFIITMFILAFYCVLTGSNVPVIRATVMACILLSSFLLERDIDIYNSLALAGFIILFVNPWQLFSISFQLSFVSVVSIIYFPPKIKALLPEGFHSNKVISYIISAVSVSLGAWIGVTPLVAYYFGIISPIAILANLIIVPYLTIVILSAFMMILTGVVLPMLLPVMSSCSEFILFTLLKMIYFFDKIPGSYFKLPSAPFHFVLVYYLFIFATFQVLPSILRRKGSFLQK